MRPGLTISSVGHAVLLGWGLIAFAPAALEAPPMEAMPVDLVPISDLTELTKGKRNAPKMEEPRPAATKAKEPVPAPDTERQVAEKKPPVQAASTPPPAPAPAPKPEPTKETPRAEAAEPVPAPLPPKRVPPKAKPKTEAAANAPKQRNFDPDKIAALIDRSARRRDAAADESVATPSLGAPSATGMRLTQSEIDALRAQIQACWNPPIGAANAEDLVVRVRVRFRIDGTLSAEPALLNRGSGPYFQVAAESAMRAVRRCQPYTMPAAKYEVWRDVEVTFDPRDMFGG